MDAGRKVSPRARGGCAGPPRSPRGGPGRSGSSARPARTRPHRYGRSGRPRPRRLPFSFGPLPSTAMIECAGMLGATRMEARVRTAKCLGFMLSTAVGGRRRTASSFSSPLAVAASANWRTSVAGSVRRPAAIRPRKSAGHEGPAMGCGDEDHALDEGQRRVEHGCCRSSRVSGVTLISSNGLSLMLSQNRVPLSIAVSLVRSPPWLCPITTMRWSAGSLPSGSSSCTVAASAARRRPAE